MQLSSALLLLCALAAPICAQLVGNDLNATPRNLNVSVDATFPDQPEAERVGHPKIVNGLKNKVNIAITYYGRGAIGIQSLGGSLLHPETGVNVKNLTQQKLNLELSSDQNADLPYIIQLDMHPQDLRLNLQLVLKTPEQTLVTATAANVTVSIVEQPMSLLDPQLLFLYLVLLSGVGGAAYWAYNYWLDTVNPKKKRPVVFKRAEPVSVATGVDSRKFDESWIPEHHIKRATSPKARGVKLAK